MLKERMSYQSLSIVPASHRIVLPSIRWLETATVGPVYVELTAAERFARAADLAEPVAVEDRSALGVDGR